MIHWAGISIILANPVSPTHTEACSKILTAFSPERFRKLDPSPKNRIKPE